MSDVTLKDLYDLLQAFREEVRGTYVTKDEFAPVKAIVFGLISLMGTTVLIALVSTVIKAR